MKNIRPHRGLSYLLASAVGSVGLAVAGPGVASAAPHHDSPPSVQVGWTDSATPAVAHDAGGEKNLPMGTSIDETGTAHTARVYATFDLSRYEGKTLSGGTVVVEERNAADCTKRAIELWRTKPVGSTPTWAGAPKPIAKLDEIRTPEACPRARLTFDVGAAVQEAAAKKQRRLTFELRVPAEFEKDPTFYRELYWYGGVRLSLAYNSLPKIDNARLYNGGFACSQLRPYPRLGSFAGRLEASGTDADEADNHNLKTEYAIWPTGDAQARTVLTAERGTSGRVNPVTVPNGTLVDGTSYAWQARVGDGAATSAWSKKCFFTYDVTAPPAPTVTSANYPQTGTTPPGVPGEFTFSGNGNPDVAGFEYSWSELGVGGCSEGGDVGQLVCSDRLTGPGVVKAAAPGGTATVKLSPTASGREQLTVRSIDLAGNVSAKVTYAVYVPDSAPATKVVSGPPKWGEEIVLKFVPADGVTGVSEYVITLDGERPETRRADDDGTARFSFRAHNPDGHRVRVFSRSDNGFVSPVEEWSVHFDPSPGVTSDVYVYRPDGRPVGGVGVPGTFTFSPPPGWTNTAAYRYSFGDGPSVEVPAGADGKATVTWTPSAAGPVDLTVDAIRADGSRSDWSNVYSFEVAAAAV